MDNSILTMLPVLHAAILSILLLESVAFFFYSYQVLCNLKEQLSDLRIRVAQTMSTPTYYKAGAIKYQDYFKNNTLDLEKIRRELHDLSRVTIPEEIRKRFAETGLDLGSSKDETKQKASRFLDIINLLTITSPYSERSSIDEKSVKLSFESRRLEYEVKWKDDLISLNGFLSWIWQGRREEILELNALCEFFCIWHKIRPHCRY